MVQISYGSTTSKKCSIKVGRNTSKGQEEVPNSTVGGPSSKHKASLGDDISKNVNIKIIGHCTDLKKIVMLHDVELPSLTIDKEEYLKMIDLICEIAKDLWFYSEGAPCEKGLYAKYKSEVPMRKTLLEECLERAGYKYMDETEHEPLNKRELPSEDTEQESDTLFSSYDNFDIWKRIGKKTRSEGDINGNTYKMRSMYVSSHFFKDYTEDKIKNNISKLIDIIIKDYDKEDDNIYRYNTLVDSEYMEGYDTWNIARILVSFDQIISSIFALNSAYMLEINGADQKKVRACSKKDIFNVEQGYIEFFLYQRKISV